LALLLLPLLPPPAARSCAALSWLRDFAPAGVLSYISVADESKRGETA